jgi:hypothetical protein
MTTQDQHAPTEASRAQADSMTKARKPWAVRPESPMEQTQPFRPFSASMDGGDDASASDGDSSTKRPLFADDVLAGFRERWDDVQAGFVDDPRECVEKADDLVADVAHKLMTGFSDARLRLEEQWARGEDASTEELRLALKRYRVFFQRLLRV